MFNIKTKITAKWSLILIVGALLIFLYAAWLYRYGGRVYLIRKENNQWVDLTPCSPKKSPHFITLDVCNCSTPARKSLKKNLEKSVSELNYLVCGKYSGNDGVIAVIKINEAKKTVYLPSFTCKEGELSFNESKRLKVTLSEKKHGKCAGEYVLVRNLWVK